MVRRIREVLRYIYIYTYVCVCWCLSLCVRRASERWRFLSQSCTNSQQECPITVPLYYNSVCRITHANLCRLCTWVEAGMSYKHRPLIHCHLAVSINRYDPITRTFQRLRGSANQRPRLTVFKMASSFRFGYIYIYIYIWIFIFLDLYVYIRNDLRCC